MPERPLIVLKFGGSVLRAEGDLTSAAAEVYRWHRRGWRVVAVASAYHGVTDRLAGEARRWPDGCDSARAALIGAGETRAACHLALRLRESGLRCRFVPVSEAGLLAEGPALASHPRAVDRARLHGLLARHDVLILPGFQAQGPDGEPRLLGRGGSDLTALVLAEQLQADRCRLVKDTHGLFEFDPALAGPRPGRYRAITWADAARLGDQVLQPRALAYARRHQRPFDFAAPGRSAGTLVGADSTALDPPREPGRPRRVALAGCGTVGGGLAAMLADLPWLELASVAVRRRRRSRPDLPDGVTVVNEPRDLLASAPDVVVDTMGDGAAALPLLRAALARGIPVVTADKDLLAHHGPELRSLADQAGTVVRGSAACGGGAPMLEQTRQLASAHPLVRLQGVINGTSNWILDRLHEGQSLEDAIAAAQAAGFAEADPTADVGGHDAARKLCLLAHAAWGMTLTPAQVDTRGLDDGAANRLHGDGRRRLVAQLERRGDAVRASVSVQEVAADHSLHPVPGVRNRLVLESASGQQWVVDGDGAGRVPTAQSVLADVLDVLADADATAPTATVRCRQGA